MVEAGRLRHRVKIQQLAVTIAGGSDSSSSSSSSSDADPAGSQAEAWSDFTGWISAEIVALSGREYVAAAALQSRITTRIRIRPRPGVIASMRVVHRGTYYNIEAVLPDPDSRLEYANLMCSSGPNDG